jgi:hypothetical protein
MANYLITHYKGKYRILCDVCKDTNDFPRKIDGSYEDIDCYISCDDNIRIFSFGRGILQAYIPSLKQGNSLLRLYYKENINESNTITNINEYQVERNGKTIDIRKETISIIDNDLFEEQLKNNDVIFDIEKTDSEVLFKFKAKNMEALEKYLKPRSNGANISPFSVKNRPKTKYNIPDKDLVGYKDITSKMTQDKLFLVGKCTKDFIKSLATRKNTYENIKADMALKGLKGKDYIHSIDKWDEYIKYLENNIIT